MAEDAQWSGGPLAEFTALRAEVLQSQAQQVTLYNFQLTTTGGLLIFAPSREGLWPLLLVIPFTSYFLYGRYCAISIAMHRIARYIRDVLDPAIPGGLGWEHWLVKSNLPHTTRVAWGNTVGVAFHGASLLSLVLALPSTFFSWPSMSPLRVAELVGWPLGAAIFALTLILDRRYRNALSECKR